MFIIYYFTILLDVLLNIFSLYLNPYCNENTNKILFDAENFHIKFISKKCISLINIFFQHWKLNSVMSVIKETIGILNKYWKSPVDCLTQSLFFSFWIEFVENFSIKFLIWSWFSTLYYYILEYSLNILENTPIQVCY